MLKSDIKQMTQSKRLKLKKWEVFWHYSPSIFFLIVPMINLYFILHSYLTDNDAAFQRITDGLEIIWLFLSLSLIIFIYKYWSLGFKEIDVKIKSKHFKNAIDLTQKELDWTIITQNENYLFAYSRNAIWSWGEQITIIKKGNKVLINSICNLNQTSFFGGNQKNIEVFERNIKDCLKTLN